MNLTPMELMRIVVQADVSLLPAVLTSVRHAADKAGLPTDDLGRLEVIVEEACLNVIHHAFDAYQQGSYEVAVEKRGGRLLVTVSDQGLPFDFATLEDAGRQGIGTKLIRAFADEVRFENLGRQGKRVVLIKNLPYSTIDELTTGEEAPASVPPTLPEGEDISFRLMSPDEAVDVARCLYRGYGYTYANEVLYQPGRLREAIQSGLVEPCVAVLNDGTVVGYLASVKEELESMIADSAQAIVDPRARGRKVFERMKHFIVERARERGLHGVYSESVTVHPATQRGNCALGATELGVLLGFIPPTVSFKHFDQHKHREAIVLYYKRVNQEPHRVSHPPFHHAAIIRRIYERGNFDREIVISTGVPAEPLPAHSVVQVAERYEWGHGRIAIRAYGADIIDVVRARFRDLCLKRLDVIWLDLPLHDPWTAHHCAAFEMMGFFFGGVIPEMSNGDVLRLHFLNNVEIDPERTVLYSDFARELGAYVLKARAGA